MDVHIDEVVGEIETPAPPANQAPLGGARPNVPEREALKLRNHLAHVARRARRLRAD
jgi:hypothetical protein